MSFFPDSPGQHDMFRGGGFVRDEFHAFETETIIKARSVELDGQYGYQKGHLYYVEYTSKDQARQKYPAKHFKEIDINQGNRHGDVDKTKVDKHYKLCKNKS